MILELAHNIFVIWPNQLQNRSQRNVHAQVYTNKICPVINQWNWGWAERHVSPRPNSPDCTLEYLNISVGLLTEVLCGQHFYYSQTETQGGANCVCFNQSRESKRILLLMRPTTVVSSANLMMWLELNLAVQSWVSSVKSSGLSTQPCGAPVLSVVVLEVLWPTRTDWGIPVRKSRIQLQRELLRPSRFSLFMSCCGIIVLNAELKSMNSILT